MEREIVLGNKQMEADKREIENLNREKEIMTKNMQKIQSMWTWLYLSFPKPFKKS